MYELKSCPFCGNNAEMHTERMWPEKNVVTCESKAAAQEWLENHELPNTVVTVYMYQKSCFRAGKGRILGKWAVRVQQRGFVPRCTNSKCIGRSDLMFHTEKEAASAWNERCSNA